jgi:hypothetical protein
VVERAAELRELQQKCGPTCLSVGLVIEWPCCRIFILNPGADMSIEANWYEFSPYVYAAGGVASASNIESYISIVCGLMLLVAAATILRLRWRYRKNMVLQRERDERVKRVLKRKHQKPATRLEDDDFI